MSKLVFAAVVLLAGLAIHGALRRRAESLPPGLRCKVDFGTGAPSADNAAPKPKAAENVPAKAAADVQKASESSVPKAARPRGGGDRSSGQVS